jgi:hypothetical protein
MLYQLSYSRKGLWWGKLDLNQRRQTPAGLQPAPFDHSGIPPKIHIHDVNELTVGLEPATC